MYLYIYIRKGQMDIERTQGVGEEFSRRRDNDFMSKFKLVLQHKIALETEAINHVRVVIGQQDLFGTQLTRCPR